MHIERQDLPDPIQIGSDPVTIDPIMQVKTAISGGGQIVRLQIAEP